MPPLKETLYSELMCKQSISGLVVTCHLFILAFTLLFPVVFVGSGCTVRRSKETLWGSNGSLLNLRARRKVNEKGLDARQVNVFV